MDDTIDIDGLRQNINELRLFVHGTEAENVVLGGVATPTLRHLVRSIEDGVDAVLARAEKFESRLARLEVILEEIQKQYDEKGSYCGPVAVGSIHDISKAGVVFVLDDNTSISNP